MKILTCLEASQDLEAVLDIVDRDGAVKIRRKDGMEFILQPARFRGELLKSEPASSKGSPLDADANANPMRPKITTEEIVEIVRKGREWDRW